MAAPENLGRGIFPIIAPPRERTAAPVLPRPDVRPSPVSPEPPKKSLIQRMAGSLAVRIALAGTALAGTGYAAYENFPAVHKTVDPAFLDHIKGKSSEASIAETVFDNSAAKGVIKPSMIERLPQEEMDKLDPFAKIDDHNTVQVLYPIDISTSNKPDSNIKLKKANGDSGDEQDRENRTKEGFLNLLILDTVPAGSTILAPVDGRLTVFTERGNSTPINDHDFGTAAIDFKVKGEEYRMVISGGTKGGIRSRGDVFRSLTNAPVVGYNMSPSEQLRIKEKQAISIKTGDPILQVADTEINISMHLIGNIDMSKGKETVINGTKVLLVREEPTNLELLSPNRKLVAPKK